MPAVGIATHASDRNRYPWASDRNRYPTNTIVVVSVVCAPSPWIEQASDVDRWGGIGGDGDHHGDNGDDDCNGDNDDDADDGYRDDDDGDGNDDGNGDDADDDADEEQGSDGDRWGERRRAYDMTTTLATIRNRIEDKRRDEDKRTLTQRISAANGP